MATIKELTDTLNKAIESRDKVIATIQRHKSQLEKMGKQLISKGIDIETKTAMDFAGKNNDLYWDMCGYEDKIEAILSATKKLSERERILADCNLRLNKSFEQDKLIEETVPDIIKNFLDDWKNQAVKWHLERYDKYQEFIVELQKKEKEARLECMSITPEYGSSLKTYNSTSDDYYLHNVFPSKFMDQYLKEKKLDHQSISIRRKAFAGGVVLTMCTYRNVADRTEFINKICEEEKKRKLLSLISKVNDKVGKITDVTRLDISDNGELCGIIIGDIGACKINIVGAGGFNIQCFHFREFITAIDIPIEKSINKIGIKVDDESLYNKGRNKIKSKTR